MSVTPEQSAEALQGMFKFGQGLAEGFFDFRLGYAFYDEPSFVKLLYESVLFELLYCFSMGRLAREGPPVHEKFSGAVKTPLTLALVRE